MKDLKSKIRNLINTKGLRNNMILQQLMLLYHMKIVKFSKNLL